MSAETSSASTRTVQVAGLDVFLREGGSGEPLVLLHHSTGNLNFSPFMEKLAENFSVIAPDMPGYGQSTQPAWARHPRDMALLMLQLLDELNLDKVHLVGLGFGGWIAAELAVASQTRLKSLTLVGASGIQPREGQIYDQMLVVWEKYVAQCHRDEASFEETYGDEPHEDVIRVWDFNREMTARLNWKPWMFSRQLPHLLGGVKVPALVVWGDTDRVIPQDTGNQYAELLGNAKLEVVAQAGHHVDVEQPEALAGLIAGHAKS
jgi:pimeloyl-ACP methyl ester carboxylesterase